MAGLTIGWECLTGYYRATDSASRQRAEWPPHPARVYMALAAAWFETGEDADEGNALRWLEKLGDPELTLPSSNNVFRRETTDVYVPVNDCADPYDWPDKKKKPTIHPHLGSVAIGRSRQARTFPCVWIGEAPCFLHWPDAKVTDVTTHRVALDRLCGKVTRIGHPSSLVRMWLAEEAGSSHTSETWAPNDGLAEFQVRRISQGTLGLLDRQFNRQGREEYEQLSNEVVKLKAAKKAVGRGSKERKAEIDVEIEKLHEQLKLVDNREPIRPNIGLWSGYCLQDAESPAPAQHTDFDSDLLILTQTDGPRLPLASTLALTQALRGAVLSHVHQQFCGCARWDNRCPSPSDAPECYAKIPAWVSGHADDSQPLRDGRQHLAFVALPFVGSEYADGHLLGAALVFSRTTPRSERGQVLGKFLLQPTGQSRQITLTLGSLGVWTLAKRDWTESRQTLKPETWTAHPPGTTTWATVTPIVLDRFPKSDPVREREDWQREVAETIATACQRLGLPRPLEVDFGTTSWHRGSLRACTKRRPLRGHDGFSDGTTSFGDGFPIYPAKQSNGSRPQFHIFLKFAKPVIGPILLGAGRFMGYGLCRPLGGGDDR